MTQAFEERKLTQNELQISSMIKNLMKNLTPYPVKVVFSDIKIDQNYGLYQAEQINETIVILINENIVSSEVLPQEPADEICTKMSLEAFAHSIALDLKSEAKWLNEGYHGFMRKVAIFMTVPFLLMGISFGITLFENLQSTDPEALLLVVMSVLFGALSFLTAGSLLHSLVQSSSSNKSKKIRISRDKTFTELPPFGRTENHIKSKKSFSIYLALFLQSIDQAPGCDPQGYREHIWGMENNDFMLTSYP